MKLHKDSIGSVGTKQLISDPGGGVGNPNYDPGTGGHISDPGGGGFRQDPGGIGHYHLNPGGWVGSIIQ
ncbi:hypothetical protein J5Y03_10160 [Bacillus sp. RG28]|uniref:Uncharacterized protein n=1 Tax=Gottfriedia endophytica TaxID=2820819 RepID=A0A940SJK0_9BACI|nr:hypothetical protein [Gottfriedia endophytica]MBP0725551.1 hypothetical protein [Gottfriedia endophytica]